MTRWMWICLLVCGCAPSLRGAQQPPPVDVQRALDAVVAEWRAEGLPWTERCDAERELVSYHEVDNDEMLYQTGYCAADSPVCIETRDAGDAEAITLARAQRGCTYGICTAGSIMRYHSQPWPIGLWSTWRVNVIVSSYLAPDVRLEAAVHEYAHALGSCSGLGPDNSHSNQQIWGLQGVVARAQAAVREGH